MTPEDRDQALAARQAERDRQCCAGDDLHAELLPPDHPQRAVLPALDAHPLRAEIEAAQRAAAPAAAAAQPARRGVPWATWVPGIPNFTPKRSGHDMWTEPRFIVLHTMVGWESAARARFQQPSQQASSTYGVTLKGELFQYVSEADAPWTNGTTYGPVGGNLDSITIEHEDGGDYDGPRTPELYAASARAVRDIADFYAIPLDRGHVVSPHELGHRECTGAATACPDALDLDLIVQMAIAGVTAAPPPGGDAMGGHLIPYERPTDPNGTQALGEIYCAGGEAVWGVWTGAAGMMVSYTDPLTSLGSPEDAKDLVDAEGAHALHQGVLRLHVRGVRADGSRWLAVYDAHSFAGIEPWKRMPSPPLQDVAIKGPKGDPGPAGPAGAPGKDGATAAEVAVEMGQRILNG